MHVPLAEDVVLLNKCLSKTAVSLKESLKNGFCESTYSNLAEVSFNLNNFQKIWRSRLNYSKFCANIFLTL